jgi:hypothetical protein
MAIIKDRPTQFGINAQYHRIDKVEVNAYSQEVVLSVATYPSAEARQSGSQPLSVDRMIIPFWRMVEDPRATFYKLLADYDGGPLYQGDADDDPGEVPQFTVKPWEPPQLPPAPTATSGPESVPGYIPPAAE